MRLGFHQLRIMTFSLSLRYTFPLGQVGVLNYEEFWRTSLYRALVTRALVSQLKQGDPDEAFFAGLAMEIGLLTDKSARFHTLFNEARRRFGLDQEVILDTIWATFEQVEETGRQLRLELDRDKDLLEIMEKANRALSRISALVAKAPEAVTARPRPSSGTLDTGEGAVAHTLQAVAHEIRNPLTVIGGFARRLSTNLDPDTPTAVSTLRSSSTRLPGWKSSSPT